MVLVRPSGNRSGFSLVEILVVVGIIGTLAAIVFISLKDAQSKSRYSKVLGDMENIAKAVKAYSIENNNDYPAGDGSGTGGTATAAYLPGGNWPVTPCGSPYGYSYYNFGTRADGTCNPTQGNTDKRIGIVMTQAPAGVGPGQHEYIYYYNIKNYQACTEPAGSNGWKDIKNVSPKTISCKE